MKKLSLLTTFLGITTSTVISAIPHQLNYSLDRTIDEHVVKSNYSYLSGWTEVTFDDTVLITTIYKEVDKLLTLQAQTGIKTNIDVGKILFKIEPNNYRDFDNYETILTDVEKYIQAGKVDSSYYRNFKLNGDEWYSWDWGHAVPGYTWTWKYSTPSINEPLFTYHNYGYGNSDHEISFKFDLSYDK